MNPTNPTLAGDMRLLLERLLDAANAVGVPEHVVYELQLMEPDAPFDQMPGWSDEDLQQFVQKAYIKNLGDQASDQAPDEDELLRILDGPQQLHLPNGAPT